MLVSTLFLAALATGLAPISTTASPVSLNNNGHGQAPTSSLGPVVQLKQGSYAGNATLPGVVFFGGLPYAEPPLGDLRWRPPAKLGHHGKRKQQTVVDARNWGPLCIQQPAVNGIGQEGTPRSPPFTLTAADDLHPLSQTVSRSTSGSLMASRRMRSCRSLSTYTVRPAAPAPCSSNSLNLLWLTISMLVSKAAGTSTSKSQEQSLCPRLDR